MTNNATLDALLFTETNVRAVEGKINAGADRIKLYTAEIPAHIVATFYVEAASLTAGGFQRVLDESRAAKIGRLNGGDKVKHVQPPPNVHGGLLAYADADEVSFSNGNLTIKKPLRLIDGQHRAGGARWAVKNGETYDWTETVRVVVGATKPEIAMWYLRCNLEARKVAPANIIQNVATMNGTVLRRKTWVARAVVALASQEPFADEKADAHLVSFSARDGGRIQAQTLYRAIDVLLPPELDREGPEIETKAVQYAWNAFDLYAKLFPDWGEVDDKGKLLDKVFYTFTSLVAYGRLYMAAYEEGKKDEEIEAVMRKAWVDSGIFEQGMDGFGSGEKAATALASYAAGQAGISLMQLAA